MLFPLPHRQEKLSDSVREVVPGLSDARSPGDISYISTQVPTTFYLGSAEKIRYAMCFNLEQPYLLNKLDVYHGTLTFFE